MPNSSMSEKYENYRPPKLRRSILREVEEDMLDTLLCRPWSMWLERVTERQEKELDLLVGNTLVRMRFEAAYREEGDMYAMLSCTLTCIDGQTIGRKEQKERAAVFESKKMPTADKQTAVFRQALVNWGIRGNAIPVTKKYVAGHMRVAALRKRFLQNKKG